MEPTDIQLMLRVRTGDTEAFGVLAARYREPLRRFFAAALADRSQADDCAQETLLRLWLARERYEPTGRLSTYLFQIARNYGLNQRKKRAHAPVLADVGACVEVAAPAAAQPETILLERARRERVARAIAALPDRCGAVFRLSHVEGLRYAEIAGRLGIPEGTVKSRMFEAVRRLRTALADGEGG